jgi:hypothetical protein
MAAVVCSSEAVRTLARSARSVCARRVAKRFARWRVNADARARERRADAAVAMLRAVAERAREKGEAAVLRHCIVGAARRKKHAAWSAWSRWRARPPQSEAAGFVALAAFLPHTAQVRDDAD